MVFINFEHSFLFSLLCPYYPLLDISNLSALADLQNIRVNNVLSKI